MLDKASFLTPRSTYAFAPEDFSVLLSASWLTLDGNVWSSLSILCVNVSQQRSLDAFESTCKFRSQFHSGIVLRSCALDFSTCKKYTPFCRTIVLRKRNVNFILTPTVCSLLHTVVWLKHLEYSMRDRKLNFQPHLIENEYSFRAYLCNGIKNKECVFKMHSFDGGPLPPSVYLGRHWRHSCDKMDQAFPLCYCILQAIEN